MLFSRIKCYLAFFIEIDWVDSWARKAKSLIITSGNPKFSNYNFKNKLGVMNTLCLSIFYISISQYNWKLTSLSIIGLMYDGTGTSIS
jgi:hypothetical protein